MADDKTGMRGAEDTASSAPVRSTTPTKPVTPPAADIPEARILEETIVRPPESAPAPQAAPTMTRETISPRPATPSPIVQTQTKEVTSSPPSQPLEKKTAPAVPAMTFGSFIPNGSFAVSEKKMSEPLPSREPPQTPQSTPVSGPTNPPPSPLSHQPPASDVSKLLQGIKLPERRTAPGISVPEVKPRTYDTSLGKMLSEEPQEGSAIAPNQKEAPPASSGGEKSSIVTPLRTLKNDFQDIVRDKKISLVKAASMEQDRKRDPTGEFEQRPRRHRTFRIIFVSAIFAILGTGIFFGIAFVTSQKNATVRAPSDTSLLFAESSVQLPLTNRSAFDVKGGIASLRNENRSLGSITRIVPTIASAATSPSPESAPLVREATTEEFFTAIGLRASPNLTRALDSRFFLGIHTVDENAPVMVIPVLSYERAFAAMLEWEETMNADLAPVFSSVPPTVLGENGLLEKRRFGDITMRNYDTRALKDNSGTIQMYYVFPTRNILIIAESPYSFVEILSRLRAERRL